MKWNKVYLKLSLTIFSLFLVILVLLSMVINQIFSNFYTKKAHEEANELALHLSTMLRDRIYAVETMAEFSEASIYLVNGQGQFLDMSASTKQKKIQAWPNVWENARLLQGKQIEKEFNAGDQLYLLHGIPVNSSKNPVIKGIYVVSSLEHMIESIRSVRYLIGFAGFGTLLLALGCIFILAKKLSAPLVEMEAATRNIAKGELEVRLPVRSHDEVGSLSGAINDLAMELKRYRDTRSEFFANVSHELRTPVTYLKGYANVLANGLVDHEEEKQQYLHIIADEAHRLTVIINDLFELAKMEEGKFAFHLESVDVRRAIEKSVNKARIKAEQKGLQWVLTLETIPRCLVDPVRLEQVLLNLLDNAIRYTREGTIKLTLQQENGLGVIMISDSGSGIPPDELPYIFERFYRVEKSRSRELGGTGLGLAIVQKLVQLQGGTIEVESVMGRGTVFRLSFPLA
ncbi:ATP-binding protein [Paenibacillus peoriae]|uniref:HAMP domain-containing sensor histidine kinase n=1 Tax=Paenibacillus peoriae TaxID=59893 RepID=UPI00026C5D34|nr:ATP-binding protein [Paenibacillus peoriae]MEC0181047.1 ATP-binding protein [Paenibacillus peoriae]